MEAKRKAAEKIASEKIVAENIATENIATEKIAAEKIAAEKIATEKIAAEKIATEKIAAEKIAMEKIAAEKIDAEKIDAEKIDAEKIDAEKIATENIATENIATEKIAAEKIAAEKIATEKIAAEKIATEKIAAEKIATEKIDAEKIATEKIDAEKIATEKIDAEKIATEKIDAEKIATEKIDAEKIDAEKIATEKIATEKLAAEKIATDKIATEVAKRVAEEVAKRIATRIATEIAEKEAKKQSERASKEKAEKKANEQRMLGLSVLVAVLGILLYMILINGSNQSKSSTPVDLEKMQAQIREQCSEIFTTFQNDAKREDEARFDSISDKIDVVKRDISMKVNADNLKKTDISMKVNADNLRKTEELFERELTEIKRKYNQSLDKVQETFTENMTTFTTALDGINRTLSEYMNLYTELEAEMQNNNKTFKDALTDLQTTLKDKLLGVETQLVAIDAAKEEADTILGRIKDDVDTIFPTTFNKGALTAVILVLVLFEFILAYRIYRVQHGTYGDLQRNTQIPRSVSTSKGVCVVSFDEARQAAHEALVRSAMQTIQAKGNINIQWFVVRRHEHLVNIPRCSLYIICTEFSERHVIIEEPGLGLGDLKRCTYQTVERFKAAFVILYTQDPGSRNLIDQLYNTNIHCVSTQPELVRLRDLARFYSLYDKLSNSQKQSLQRTIVQCTQ